MSEFFWFTDRDFTTTDPATLLLDPLWKSPFAGQPQPLFAEEKL
jgi:hypothetical protein